jgi:hypothetical protein
MLVFVHVSLTFLSWNLVHYMICILWLYAIIPFGKKYPEQN